MKSARHSTRAAGLIALVAVFGFTAIPCFAGQPEKALSTLDVRDVDNSRNPARGRQPDKPVCSVDGRGAKVEQMLKQLWDDFAPLFGSTDWNSFGPDSSYRQIRLEHGGKVLMLRSWHPIYERDKRVVATSRGLTPLGGRSRADILREDDRGYVARRVAFDALVDLCLAMSTSARR
jgi:hypothetical protein